MYSLRFSRAKAVVDEHGLISYPMEKLSLLTEDERDIPRVVQALSATGWTFDYCNEEDE
jgi:hypothetical protein